MEEQFKEATRSDCSYIDGGNLTSLQHVIERRANQFAPMKKNVLRENDKLHTDMPTFPKPKEGDFPRLASPEGPPWLGLRGRKF